MLQFLKNELQKQNNVAALISSFPMNNQMQQLNALIVLQQTLLKSLIKQVENSLYLLPSLNKEMTSYHFNYCQQQSLLAPTGYGYYLPDLNPYSVKTETQPMSSTQSFNIAGEEKFFDGSRFLPKPTRYVGTFFPAAGSNTPTITPAQQYQIEPNYFTDVSAFTHNEYDNKNPRNNSIPEIKVTSAKSVQKPESKKRSPVSPPNDKRGKNREAARAFRLKQSSHIESLETQVTQLGLEEQTIKRDINALKDENVQLRTRLEFLRGVISKSIEQAYGKEEPSSYTPTL